MTTADISAQPLPSLLANYGHELGKELESILAYWQKYSVDEGNGGFHGSINHLNEVVPDAPRGIVMYARICWAFSAAYRHAGNPEWLQTARRAADYIMHYFTDTNFGGVYWSVDENGQLLDGKKQIYGQAFCIYGLAEYFMACADETALKHAIELFHLIEKYSFDPVHGGYVEAFTNEWKEIEDLRLSDKDDNARKTMNTHLHVIEAYATLYKAWPDELLRQKLGGLLEVFSRFFIDPESHHLHLFFDDAWKSQSRLQSYGHDIEAAWLLQQCAETAGYPLYVEKFRSLAVSVTNAAAEGLDTDGGLWYEYDPANGTLIKEKHSWPQAEAMIGFFNAYQLTGRRTYLGQSLAAWKFVKNHLCDRSNGEWFWGVYEDYSIMKKDKAGFWKCPYHNTRACLEIISRIKQTLSR